MKAIQKLKGTTQFQLTTIQRLSNYSQRSQYCIYTSQGSQNLHNNTNKQFEPLKIDKYAQSSFQYQSTLNYSKESGQEKPGDIFDEDTMLKLDNKTGTRITIVGTAHISAKSAKQVKDVIQKVKPDAVMVELCKQRASKLLSGKESNPFQSAFQRLSGHFQSGQMPNLGAEVFNFGISSFYAFLKQMGLEPGKEFQVALEEGNKVGATIIYGDKNVKDIMDRISQSTNFFEIVNSLRRQQVQDPELQKVYPQGATLEQIVEHIKNRKSTRILLRQMERLSPGLFKALITERNEYMVDQLMQIQAKRVVAVVGLGHLDGIEQLWMQEQAKTEQKKQGEPTL